MSFPTPVGGTSFPEDFAPSIVFAVLYALIIPLMLFRVYDKHSRTPLLIGSIIFGVERVVIFSIRAIQSHSESKRLSNGLLKYMQISFAVGFLGIANDLVNILRVYLVNPTYGPEKFDECPAFRDEKYAASGSQRLVLGIPLSRPRPLCKGAFPGEPYESTPDHPRTRFWARRFSDFTNLAFLAASVPGGVINAQFENVINDPAKSKRIMTIRYESTAVGLFLVIIIMASTVWGRVRLSRVSTKGARILIFLCFLLSIIGTYRLSVMFHKTTSLNSRAPGSLNSHGAKAGFYILHVLPEWLAIVTMFTFNMRQIFGTGLWGDYRYRDDTPKDRQRREKREAKRAEKKRQKQKQLAARTNGEDLLA